jgi:uncharacterized protein (TIGR03086 family)
MSTDLGHDPLQDLDRSMSCVETLIASVPDAGWGTLTPCRNWTVRNLVNHIVSGCLILTAATRSHDTEQPDWTSDKLGTDPLETFRRAEGRFRAALAEPGALDRTYDSVLGQEPGSALIRMRVSEHVVHGWDLARTLGRSTDLVPDLAEQVLAFWRAGLGDVPRDGMPFDAAVAAPEGATTADRLAAYLGRTVT